MYGQIFYLSSLKYKYLLTYTLCFRIIYRMKVTALIPDNIINEVKNLSGGKNITESITIALTDWLKIQKIKRLNSKINSTPLMFKDNFSSNKVRELNRI